MKKEFGLLAVLVFAALVLSLGTNVSKPFTSSEVKFADVSAAGLSIVPASCESGVVHYTFIDPYTGGFHTECDCPAGTTFGFTGVAYACIPNPTPPPPPTVTPPPPPTGVPPSATGITVTCQAPGAGALLSWPATPGATGYTLNFDDTSNPWAPVRCDGTINDGNPGDMCNSTITGSPGYHFAYAVPGHTVSAGIRAFNAAGSAPATSVSFTCSCPTGQVWNGSACIPTPTCTDGQILNIDTCVCPAGTTMSGGTCVSICSAGETWDGTACVSTCPTGTGWNGTACMPFACTGSTPSNASLCSGDGSGLTADTPRTVQTSCGAAKCEYLCNSGFTKSGNTCVSVCPSGETWNGTSCVSKCTGGQTWNGTTCVCPTGVSCTCPSGQSWNGTACVSFCSGGQVWNGSACACPSGQSWNGSMCVGSCIDNFFCQGNNLMHQSSSCVNTVSQICSFGCSNGACNSQPEAVINFTVSPLLVRKGEPTHVVWSTINTTSCTVTSTNGASWTGINSTAATPACSSGSCASPAVQGQTVFTIRCNSTTGSQVSQTATVNIIPVFCEPGTPGC